MWNDVDPGDDSPDQGCLWPVIYPCEPSTDVDSAVQEWSEQMAIEILWAASGRRFGLCTSKYRPCRVGCQVGVPVLDAWNLVGRRTLVDDAWAGSMFALIGCGCRDNCSCSTLEALDLWHTNVREVTEVVIDGVTLSPSAYRLSRNKLLRVDGESWPTCQDWTVDADQDGAWTVEYVHGKSVPYGGRVAVGILATELRKAVCDDESCALPRRVQTVTRQGVSVAFIDPMTFLNDGLTGLYEVDLWILSVNPGRLKRRARVHRVDDPRRNRATRAR